MKNPLLDIFLSSQIAACPLWDNVQPYGPSPIMDHKHVHGQVFDYMRYVKTYFSVKHMLGIVTTYTQWRFYWFEQSDHYAAADTCASIENLGDTRTEHVIHSVRDDDDDEDTDEEDNTNTVITQSNGDDDNAPVEVDKSPRVLHPPRCTTRSRPDPSSQPCWPASSTRCASPRASPYVRYHPAIAFA